MKRNVILSIVIGILTTYLPIWQWDGAQAAGTVACSFLAWVIIQGTEPETKNGS